MELERIQKRVKFWECLGVTAEKMSPCHNLMHQFFAPSHSLHNLCHLLCVVDHVPLWGRRSSASLVHHPVSNELPATVKVAGKPCKAFHHRTTWRDMVGLQEMMGPLAALWWPLGDIYKTAKTQQWAGSQVSLWLLLITDPFTLFACI